MSFPVVFDRAIRVNAGRCQRGCLAFHAAVNELFPATSNVGCYAPRNVTGGSSPSKHMRGEADDVSNGWPGTTQYRVAHPQLQHLVDISVRRHADLGIQQIIFNGHIWNNQTKTWRRFLSGNGGQHLDHAHIEFTAQASRELTVGDATRILAEEIARDVAAVIPPVVNTVLTRGGDYSMGDHQAPGFTPNPVNLAAEGWKFACRYLCYDEKVEGQVTGVEKRLTKEEADALLAVGISPVSNWEASAMRMGLHGTRELGRQDATEAERLHRERGGPPHVPIYFSDDIDPRGRNLQRVFDYLDGCIDVLGFDRVGVYGGYETIKQVADVRKAAWFWQTYGWSLDANGAVKWHPAAHIRQVKNSYKTIDGVALDLDEARFERYGQWTMPRLVTDNPKEGNLMLTKYTIVSDDGTVAYDAVFFGISNAVGTPHIVEWTGPRDRYEGLYDWETQRSISQIQGATLAGPTPTGDRFMSDAEWATKFPNRV